jgi:hypothetical protein
MSAKKQIEKEIREAYIFLRENNMSVPSETLQFMLDASLDKLQGQSLPIDSVIDCTNLEPDFIKALRIADVSKFDWEQFLDYVNSYDPKKLAGDKVVIIVKDLLYGIGISLDDRFTFADGYKRFMDDIKENF